MVPAHKIFPIGEKEEQYTVENFIESNIKYKDKFILM